MVTDTGASEFVPVLAAGIGVGLGVEEFVPAGDAGGRDVEFGDREQPPFKMSASRRTNCREGEVIRIQRARIY